jgi:hypothetical protein
MLESWDEPLNVLIYSDLSNKLVIAAHFFQRLFMVSSHFFQRVLGVLTHFLERIIRFATFSPAMKM